MLRLGLCCTFYEEPIRFRRLSVRQLEGKIDRGDVPEEIFSILIAQNLSALSEALDFCSTRGIASFRITSELFPLYTHPKYGYQLEAVSRADELFKQCDMVREKAQRMGIRLTLHPDQFVVLSAHRSEVVSSSLRELEYHAIVAELVGADVICLHGGGGYGDKPEALKRFKYNFLNLSKSVQSRLALENDDKVFTPQDLLPVCSALGIPLIYDVHHHRCLPDLMQIEEASKEALASWNREPLFHISSPKEGWSGKKLLCHSDYISMDDMPQCWRSQKFTLEVEAKAKELAVISLSRQLQEQGWALRMPLQV